MSASWSDTPVLGAAPLFHADPTLGGPPLLTPDGHWRWNGDHWVAVDTSVDRSDATQATPAASDSFAA